MMRRVWIVLSALWLLSACSSTPTQYYQLPDSAFYAPNRSAPQMIVRVQLAEPLKSSGLLYQTDAYRVNMAQQNLWSTPLDSALAVSLSNKLNRLRQNTLYFPHHLSEQRSPILTVYFDRFQGTYHGHTEISGYVQFPDGKRKSFQAHTPQQGDGYAAMLESLNHGLEHITEQIAPLF